MFASGYYASGYYATPYYTGNPAVPDQVQGNRWTYFTLIQEARGILGDEGPIYFRYPTDQLINNLNRGLHELSRIRPDAYYDRFTSLNDFWVPEITDDDNPVPGQDHWLKDFVLDLRFYPPLVTYVVGMAYASEDAHREDGRAEAQLDIFHRHVLSI